MSARKPVHRKGCGCKVCKPHPPKEQEAVEEAAAAEAATEEDLLELEALQAMGLEGD